MSRARDRRVAIVGGGITGLAAAWQLQRAGVDYVLFESSQRLGGKVWTERDGEFTLELGADAFLLRKPWARQLARELGLDGRVAHVNRPPVSTYVLHRGRPVALPDGLALLAPAKWRPFFASPLFSPIGKLRAAVELFVPRRRDEGDETLASFVRRRFGRQILDRVAEPMLAGVFNGEADRQSMSATFPQFQRLEREHGSVIRGLRRERRRRDTGDAPAFFSFHDGAGELIRALAEQLRGEIRLGSAAGRIERRDGSLDVSGDLFDAVILTTTAAVAADVVEPLASSSAAAMRRIRYTGIGSIYLAYRRDDVSHPLDAFGLVIPAAERRPIDGMTWTSSKWAGRAPADVALVRVFFGGPNSRASLSLDDAGVLSMAHRECEQILGVHGRPIFHRIHRWPDGYPQYDLGHLDLVDEIERSLPPGVFVAGCSYRGVGVPDCVRQGGEAAKEAIQHLASSNSP